MSADTTIELLTWLFVGGVAVLALLLAVFGLGADPVELEHRRQFEKRREHQP